MNLMTKHFYEFGPFQLDPEKRVLWCASEPVALPPKEIETLLVLVRNHGQLVEKEELMKTLWPDTFVEEANLAVHISNLRKLLQEQANAGPCIETVPRRGYRFVAHVVEHCETSERTPTMGVAESPAAGPRSRARPLRLTIAALGAVSLLAVGIVVVRRRAQPFVDAPVRIHSVAVLPLQNLSGDPSQDYFVDGLTEMLVTDLAQIRALRVTSRTSVMRYKGTRKPVSEIAQELNVDGVIEGSVVRSGGRVRITAQLIEAKTDTHLWARTFEGNLQDVLTLQNQVARVIADEVRVRLTPQEQAELASVYVANPEAYEAYLKGRYLWNQRTPSALKQSIAFFEQAIDRDPGYALAYAGLADSYVVLVSDDSFPSAGEAVQKAKSAAQQALRLDDSLGQAHAALAYLMFARDWNFAGAEQEFRRTMERSPNYATAHHWYGTLLMFEGRFDEASRELRTAQELDPLSLIIPSALGLNFLFARQPDRAIEQAQKTLQMNPNFPAAHDLLGMAYQSKGMNSEAIAEFRKYYDLSGRDTDTLMRLAHAYAVAGKTDEARKILEQMENPPKGLYISPNDIATVYAGLGEKDKVFLWLDRALQKRASGILLVFRDPAFDSIRQDPRYRQLLRRVGLSQ